MATGTYASDLTLEIDGKVFIDEKDEVLIPYILQISVEESLHMPAMFTLVVANPYFPSNKKDGPWKNDSLFDFGKTVKIKFGASTTDSPEFSQENQGYVISGEITSIESHFTTESQAPMIVRGYDASHRLHRGRYNRAFQNMSDTDIVRQIASESGISTGTIDQSGGPYGYGDIPVSDKGYIFQENQTNMEFLRERAARLGFELFVEDGKLNFRKPKAGTTLNLKWLDDVYSFRVRANSAEQVSGVEVRAWNYSTKKAIVANKKSEQVLTSTGRGKGSSSSSKFSGSAPKMIVVNQPVFEQTEADNMAQGLVDELGGEYLCADGRADGNAKLRPGRIVQLKDMGKYSGTYYVTETRHLYCDRIYTTEFTVRGLRGGDLVTTLFPQNRLQPGQTLLVGVVTQNKDPKGWGRVRVKFPTLTEAHESYWARMVTIGAGADRGFDCLPEIDDEVLVAFENGDIHRPYILGGVWNGTDAPPEKVDKTIKKSGNTLGTVRLRTFKTRTGHQLQFVEEDDQGTYDGIYMTTTGKHNLSMRDKDKGSDQFVEIETTNKHKLLLDDTNKKIQIKTAGGHTITLDDSGKSISMDSTGSISIKANSSISIKANSSMTIQSSGIMTVKGSIIKLN